MGGTDLSTMASVRLRLRLIPLSCTVLMLLLFLSAPALVLTPLPRDLTSPPRAMLLMPMLDTLMPTVTTTASVKLRLTLLSSMLAMLATPMLLPMELSPTPSLPPPPDSSTLPTLACAPTTLELLFLARQYQHHNST